MSLLVTKNMYYIIPQVKEIQEKYKKKVHDNVLIFLYYELLYPTETEVPPGHQDPRS